MMISKWTFPMVLLVLVNKADGAFYNRFSKWSNWSDFDRSCGQISRQRSRECVSNIPWLKCDPTQSTNEIEVKVLPSCSPSTTTTTTTTTEPPRPWLEWSAWSQFNPSCGDMKSIRTRQCRLGRNCTGDFKEIQEKFVSCPAVHGSWSMWSGWRKRISNKMMRTRHCNNPLPQHGGRSCSGSSIQIKIIPSNRHKTSNFFMTRRIVYADEVLSKVPSSGSIIACKMKCQLHNGCKQVAVDNNICYLLKSKGTSTLPKNFRRALTRFPVVVFSIDRMKKK